MALACLRAGVLIGGQSRRMGAPKHLLRVEGVSLLARTTGVLRSQIERVSVIGAGELPDDAAWLERIQDEPGAVGPLAGIAAALRSDPNAAWLIAATDLPRFASEALLWLLSMRSADHVAVIPLSERGLEPLLAIYEPQSRAEVEQMLSSGEIAPRLLSRYASVHSPVIPAALAAAWENANEPEDLRRLGVAGDAAR